MQNADLDDVSSFQKHNLLPKESDNSAPLRRRSPKLGGYFEAPGERASVLDCGDELTEQRAVTALALPMIADGTP